MLKRIADLINMTDRIAILPHIAADGDAVGSSLALAIELEAMGKKASVILEENMPQIYEFLPGIDLAHVYPAGEGAFDLVVALDCGDMERLGRRRGIFEKARVTVNIDHHRTNQGFADHDFVDPLSAATGEIVYRLFETMGIEPGKDTAICLYTAISTDTGSFRYSNTVPMTHAVCAELLKKGIDVADISKRVFDTTSYEKVRLMGEAIDSLELYFDGRAAVMCLTEEAIRRSGAAEEDHDGIINIARNIRGVEVAAMLRQMADGGIKVNLRSNYEADVSSLAAKHHGGGHKRAAGFTISGGDLQGVKKILLEDLEGML
ncbi:MAG: bifunctional oligoribonuclease/PAP phosphatase NrnA [Clostridiaceae bacterium]|nr:bifunctional oligoribonuclease/PAP phosphatase NrnA [Clostridiaceae bacterium]